LILQVAEDRTLQLSRRIISRLSPVFRFNFGVADNGNVTGATNNRNSQRSQSFTYDGLNRVSDAWSNGNLWGEAYSIDPWDNLNQFGRYQNSQNQILPFVEANQSLTANTQNQVSAFCYDTAGNVLAEAASQCPPAQGSGFTYNAENQLTFAGGTNYVYDGDGNRVEKYMVNTQNQIVFQELYWYGGGSTPLDETDGTGSTTDSAFNEYVFFNGARTARRNAGNVYYYFADHLGTARDIVQAGYTSPCYDADYTPYGVEMDNIDSCSQNYKFTGKERDSESGNDYFEARYFGSSMGRFMTPDPLPWLGWQNPSEESTEEEKEEAHKKFEDWIGNPQNLNMYAYALNNPLRYTDPTGMSGCQAGDKTFSTCTITITYDPKTSQGTLVVTGQNQGDKSPTTLLTTSVVVGGDGHVTPTGTFTATTWEKDHVSTKYGQWADTPYSKTTFGMNAFGPFQLHIKELDSRGIYIHGTMGPSWNPFTGLNSLVSPTSHGCIRMCNRDDVALHNLMPNPAGNKIIIQTAPSQ
jgi:RHS repeat-associated protein